MTAKTRWLLVVSIVIFITFLFKTSPVSAAYNLDNSSYWGGSGGETIRDVFIDNSGYIYMTGATSSTVSQGFPATASPGNTVYDNTFNNSTCDTRLSSSPSDVFVTKLRPDGRTIEWSTYLGGPCYDRAYAIEVDGNGNVFVAGRAGGNSTNPSQNFPTTAGVVQPQFMGDSSQNSIYGQQDGFIAKFSSNGTLLWSTYFGDSSFAFIRDIALDQFGNVYVYQSDVTVNHSHVRSGSGVFQDSKPGAIGDNDIVLAKISSSGDQVVWATYIGGSNREAGPGSLRVTPNGLATLLTVTWSGTSDLNSRGLIVNPISNAGYNGGQFGGNGDFYVARLNQNATGLVFGTYLGGSGGEGVETHQLALDNSSNTIVAGTTGSTNFPLVNPIQSVYGGSGGPGTGLNSNYPWDAQVSVISNQGGSLLFSTYLGGLLGESGEGLAGVDAQGLIYLVGGTYSTNFPTTFDAYQTTNRAAIDGFVSVIDPAAGILVYSTYMGGTNMDILRSSHVNSQGSLIVGGENNSTNFPVVNAYKTFLSGISDGMFAKFSKTATLPSPIPTLPFNTPPPISPIPTQFPTGILQITPLPTIPVGTRNPSALALNWGSLYRSIQPGAGVTGLFFTPTQSGSGGTTLGNIISAFIPTILIIMGLLLLLFLLYGGFKFITSAGDPGKVASARSVITAALIGFAVVFMAYWIVQFIGVALGLTQLGSIFR